jgi:hypothetical protein
MESSFVPEIGRPVAVQTHYFRALGKVETISNDLAGVSVIGWPDGLLRVPLRECQPLTNAEECAYVAHEVLQEKAASKKRKVAESLEDRLDECERKLNILLPFESRVERNRASLIAAGVPEYFRKAAEKYM